MFEAVRHREMECVRIGNRSLSLLVTRSVGPRLLKLRFRGHEDILADLPDATLASSDAGVFHFRGGHRFWHAPENPERTYLPDDDPVNVTEIEGGAIIVQPTEDGTALQKSMRVTIPDDGPMVVIDHKLTNHGAEVIETAPWAITQLRPGGIAILPQPTEGADRDEVLPNRLIVLWPYTDIKHSCIEWGNHQILVRADLQDGAQKIGYPNPRGWLGYLWENVLFVKRAAFDHTADYFDRGASSQCYCNPNFLELETLGPRTKLEAGGAAYHREVWQLNELKGADAREQAIPTLIESLDSDGPTPHFEAEDW